jgi:hypothetical protein
VHINNKDRSCWKEAFRYIFNKVESKRKLLISFSHGAAFGINVDIGEVVRPNKKGEPEAFFQADLRSERGMRVTSNPYFYLDEEEVKQIKALPQWTSLKESDKALIDEGKVPLTKGNDFCSKLELLWISDLADALHECLGGEKIDLMLMNNCYMQSFDTGYVLRDRVDYILAPEGSLEAIGYDYRTLLNRINNRPEADVMELAKNVVGDYVNYYQVRNDTYNLARQAVFLLSTKSYYEALDLFVQFITILEQHLDGIIGDLTDIRENKILYVACNVDQYYQQYLDMIDVFQWIEMVMARCSTLFNGTQFPDAVARVKAELVKCGYKGDYLRTWDETSLMTFGYEGISVFFPLQKDFKDLNPGNPTPWCVYFGNQIPSAWEQRWRLFLRRYFALGMNLHLT